MLALTQKAHALELGSLGEDSVLVDVTENVSITYNGDNRNQRARDVSSHLDDEWWLGYNRLHSRLQWRSWSLSLRLDSAWFPSARSATDVALELTRERAGVSSNGELSEADVPFYQDKLLESGQELATRFVSWTYPAKYSLEYRDRSYELVVGDFYAQLGRGLVLSVRKLDELSGDTTLRGARAGARWKTGGTAVEFSALFGAANPLRIDDAGGRYLSIDDSVTPDLLRATEAGMPRAVDTDAVPTPAPSYAPDRIAGAELSIGSKAIRAGVQGSLLLRQAPLTRDIVRAAEQVRTGSISLEVPDLWHHGAVYFEAAAQSLSEPTAAGDDISGGALYLAASFDVEPLTFTLEGRRYRSFYPLRANVDITGAPEFSQIQYSAPPTTEPVWNDTQFEELNTCVTGGRAQTDLALSRNESAFFWVGRHDTWAELGANERCSTSSDRLNRIWDLAVGSELFGHGRRSRAEFIVGVRFDDANTDFADLNHATKVFYREEYLRHEVTRWLGGPFSLEIQGWHRRRRQTLGGPVDAWFTGQALSALSWAGRGSLGFGFEYDTNPAVPPTYVNGQVRYDVDETSSVSLFVGQSLGGLRCTSGVCRVFPPFAGARVDAGFRF